jgi:hypothetical protein
MLQAVTLVHKAAMPIAVSAVQSFARHFSGCYRLDIHTDGSPDADEEYELLKAAEGIEAKIVRPANREDILLQRIKNRPLTRTLLDGVGYNAKLELPMVIEPPYFYFDSDIIWLRPVSNLQPPKAANAFSTESWSWYNGIANEREWISRQIPRRVNSGFHYLTEPFPFDRMEDMLERCLFDSSLKYNTDQEIMAYLYPKMEMYHPEDLKRSRRGVHYDLASDPAAAIHFPGGMWRQHLDQMCQLESHKGREAVKIHYKASVPLCKNELFRMRAQVRICDSRILGLPVNLLRKIRSRLKKVTH